MTIEIVSGQPGINLHNIFVDILKQNGLNLNDVDAIMYFPEYSSKGVLHPKEIYDLTKKRAKYHIENNKDLFILTYLSDVLNAVRVEIKKHNFTGAKCHQFTKEGKDYCSNIDSHGCMRVWVEDIFDVWDKAIDELFF